MTALRILRPGLHTTVQDAGRFGHRALGVPTSGALDAEALALANALVANRAGTPALEMLYSGLALEVVGGSARAVVACAAATVERANGATFTLPAWHTVLLRAGDRLRTAAPADTAAAYLAVEGGLAVPSVLGSASTYVHGRLGGHEGRALRAGDVIALALGAPQGAEERRLPADPQLRQPERLRVMPGPQLDRFAGDALDLLLASEYRVRPASNRSGLRLEGPALAHRCGHDLLSEGLATGSIQVPGSGEPVVLIGDHPTVGGYPKIATVVSADWAAAGRLRIGGRVRFAASDAAGAAAARRDRAAWLAERIAGIETRPAAADG